MEEVKLLIKEAAKKYKIDHFLLKAIVETESAYNPNVIRYEPDYRYLYSHKECALMVKCPIETMVTLQKISWGLCQMMGSLYYELQGKDWATVLLRPEVNLKFGCEHIGNIIKKNNTEDPKDIYTIYNAGSIRHMKNGKLVNQANVDRFMNVYDSICNH